MIIGTEFSQHNTKFYSPFGSVFACQNCRNERFVTSSDLYCNLNFPELRIFCLLSLQFTLTSQENCGQGQRHHRETPGQRGLPSRRAMDVQVGRVVPVRQHGGEEGLQESAAAGANRPRAVVLRARGMYRVGSAVLLPKSTENPD